jgi:hypothetical protein
MKRTFAICLSAGTILAVGVLFPSEALAKYRCKDFQTCGEAMKAFKAGATYLDKDGDGVPCEALCR